MSEPTPEHDPAELPSAPDSDPDPAASPDSDSDSVPDPDPDRAASPDSASDSASESASDSARDTSSAPQRAQGLGILAGTALLLLILAPALVSRTTLPATVRSQLQQVGPNSTVSVAHLGWFDGLALDKVLVTDDAGLLVLLDRAELQTSLVSLAVSALTGDPVESTLVLDSGVVRVLTGDDDPQADGSPKPEPAAVPADGESTTLFAPLKSNVELRAVDVDIAFSDTRLEFTQATGTGGFEVGKDLAVVLTRTALVNCAAFSYQSKAEDGTWEETLALDAPTITFTALDVPSGDAKLKLEASLTADSARSGDLKLEAVDLRLSLADGILHLELVAKVPAVAGSVKLVLDLDSSKARAPLKIDVALNDVPVKGKLGAALPIVMPLLHSFRGRGGQFPPVSLRGSGTLDLVYGADGDLDRDQTIDSIRAKGEASVAAGGLGASLLVDGYSKAIVGLGVSGLLEGILPKELAFQGVRAPFTVEGDTVRLPEVVAKGDAVDLAFAGHVRFSGDYSLAVQTRVHKLRAELDAIVRALNRAGGVTLSGNLEAETCDGSLPSLDALADAARAEGVVDALLGSPLLEPLKAKLSGGGK